MRIRLTALPRSAAEAFTSLLYPPHCAHCSTPVTSREFLCGSCLEKAKRIEPPYCNTCSQPFDGAIDGIFTCANCAQRQFHFDCAVSAYRSRGMVRNLIHRFKYQLDYRLRHPLADWLAESLKDDRILARPFEFYVPVPLHPVRIRER